jgi:hypothetical protein
MARKSASDAGDAEVGHKLGKMAMKAATMKKPAASTAPEPKWHDAQIVPVKTAKSVNDEGSESAEDGVTDDRTTNRAQRWVFENHLHDLPQYVKKKYAELKDPASKIPGKQKQRNQLINAHVPRHAKWTAKPEPKESTVSSIFEHSIEKSSEDKSNGLKKTIMLASVFHGNRELFKEAIDEGDLWEDEDTGLWHYASRVKSRKEIMKRSAIGKRSYDAVGDEFMKGMAALIDLNISVDVPWMQAEARQGEVRESQHCHCR